MSIGCAAASWSQDAGPGLPDNPSPLPQVSRHEAPVPEAREVTWRSLPKDFLLDQKAIWLFPTKVVRGHHLLPTLAVVGVTGGLIVADPHVLPYFRSHQQNLDKFNDTVDSPITAAEMLLIPASFLAAGYAGHDSYAKGTALLAAEAYGDTALAGLGIKLVARRTRPINVPPGKSLDDTFFQGGTSFPSGHAAGAFSIATVVATRYRQHRWVPWAMYGFATVVSLSRVTTTNHFPSDVFLGAALGYTITRYQVMRIH
jgi:membrane-associated phospholipid phosphatase